MSDFDLEGRVRIDTRELNELASGISSSFRNMAAGVAGALAAVGVTNLLRESIEEARDAVKVGKLTESTILATGGAAKVTSKQVGELAESVSNYAAIDDEIVQGGANLLLTFKNVRNEVGKGNDVFNQATKLGADMSVVFKQDLNGSMIQLGKALDNPIKGVTALQRVGVSFTQQQKDQIKTLVESGKTLEAQKVILQELSSQVGGAAGAAADPWQRFQVVTGNLKEQIGTSLLPAFNSVIEVLGKNLPAVVDFVEGALMRLAPVVRVVGDAVKDAIDVVKNILRGQLDDAGVDIGAIFGLEEGSKATGAIIKTLETTGETIKKTISAVKNILRGQFDDAGVDIGSMFGFEEDSKQTDMIIRVLETVRDGVGKVIDFVTTNGPKLVDFFKAEVLPILQTVGGFIKDNLVPIIGGIGAALAAAGIVSIIGAITAGVAALAPVVIALGGALASPLLAFAALAAAAIYAYQHFEGFRNIVDTVARFVVEQFTNLIAFAQEILPQLQEAVGHVFNAIKITIGVALLAIMAGWRLWGDDLMTVVRGIFQIVKSVVETAINTIANVIRLILAVINGDWGKAWQAAKDIVSGIASGIVGVISGLITILKGVIGGWYDALKTAVSAAFKAFTSAASEVAGDMVSAGENIILGIIQGIKNMASRLVETIKKTVTDALPDYVRTALGISSPSRVFAEIGKQIPAGMVRGIASGANDVVAATNGMLSVPALRFNPNSFGAGFNGAGNGGVTIEQLNINGVEDAETFRSLLPELTAAIAAGVRY